MHPKALAHAAAATGLDAVVVCDHNSAENAGALIRAGMREGLAVVAGMEITSAEEVHVVALFPDIDAALRLQRRLYAVLPGENDDEACGMQVVVDEEGEVLAFNRHRLIGATTWDVDRVVSEIRSERGLAVAAHVDREGFGIVGQLGMIPDGLALDAIEVSVRTDLPSARMSFGSGRVILCSSDAHRIDDVGRARTFFLLREISFDEIALALSAAQGRCVLGGGRPMEDLSTHLLDIARNSLEAGATRIDVEVNEDPTSDRLVLEIRDNGRGMDAATAARASDPFFTTRKTRKVGLGLSLLEAAAKAADGSLDLESAPGVGTRVRATFRRNHVDRAPLGDLETTVLVLLADGSDTRIVFGHCVGERRYEVDSHAVVDALGGEAIASPEGIALVREAVRAGEASLRPPSGSPGVDSQTAGR